MSRCLRLSTVYPRHLAVSVHNFACPYEHESEYFSFFPVDFPHLLRCSSVAPSLSSNAVEGLAAAFGRALTNYYCATWSQGKREGKAIKRSRKEADIKTKFPISYLLRAWKREEKARKRSRKEADIKTKFPISYFGHACPK